MRMKIFESPQRDLEKNLSLILDNIQKELRHNRDDISEIKKNINILVKGMAILVSSPEPEDLPDVINMETT